MKRNNASSISGHLLCTIIFCLFVADYGRADSSCRKGCTQSDNGLLQYVAGSVYEYTFDSILTVGVNADAVSEADDTSLKVTGVAKIFAEGNCGYILQINTIKVTNTKEAIEKKILNNIQKPIYFTVVSGKVLPEICSDPAESVYSLNIKRAILSLLQVVKDGSEQEVDVFGQCPTHTSISNVNNVEVITKIRNLNACAYREQIHSGLISGVVNEQAGLRSTLLFQADYVKEAKLQQGIIDNVQLVEQYKFSGPVKGNSDVYAKVITSLKLKNVAGLENVTPSLVDYEPVSIIFQKPETYAAKNIAILKSTLSELVDLTSDYVKKESAQKFVELIRLMRNADSETLLELAAFPHPNKVHARKVYLDALFRTNTAESAKTILKQLSKLGPKEKYIATLALNFVETVDRETLNQASTLLTLNSDKELYLSIGNLVTKYCQRNGCMEKDIQAISKKFTDQLKHCKASTKKEENRIVYILKGIGNAEHLATSVASTLAECASIGHSNRIRVAAIQAFSVVKCNESLQKKAMDLLRNYNEDSELRIEAYLAAIKCPNSALANEIAEIVNAEEVNQVGGFIASNLRSIRDSTDATRELQRHYLGNIRITKHFPNDYRRYSFNNEVSYKLEALGISASSDYKLIYSQHGFLPRSARLNLTTEVFGTNFNIFEANLRQENLEQVLEYYIGPKGLLNKDFDEIVKLIESGNNGVEGSRKTRRSIVDESSKIAKKYKTYGNKNAQDLNLDLSLKFFGSELTFLSLGDNIPSSLDDIIKHFSVAFERTKKKLSSFSEEFVFHNLFLDTEFSYPTGVGVPLEFSTQGFSANKLDFGINVDIDTIIEQNWQRAKYRLKLIPSVDVNVNVKLGFNAYVLSTGLMLAANAHSAGGSDISLEFTNDGNGFNIDIDLPREKLELIDVHVNTQLFVAQQDKPTKLIALKGAKKVKSTPTENCFNQLEIVGLGICFASSSNIGDISSRDGSKSHTLNDELRLSRPFKFSFYVTTERKYNIKGTYVVQTSSGNQQWKLDFSTPGSSVSHDTSLTFELGTKLKSYGRFSLDNPQYHFAIEAGLNNNNNELVFYGQYEQNNDLRTSRIGFSKHGNEYIPIIEIHDKNSISNNINGYRADGKVIVQQQGEKQARYNFENFQIINPDNERIVVNGWADVGPASLSTELRVAPEQHIYLIKGNLNLQNGVYAAGLFINNENTPSNIYGGLAEVKVADQAYALKIISKAATWSFESTTNFDYIKSDSSSTISSINFIQDIQIYQNNQQIGKIYIKYSGEVNKFEISTEATRDQKIAALNIKFQRNQRASKDYILEANAKLNKQFIDLIAKCDVNGNLYIVDNTLTTSWGTSLSAKGELGQRFSLQDIHIDLQGTAQISGKDKLNQWVLKIIGAPEKTNSEFKLSRDNAELVKFTSETQHPQEKISAGKLYLIIKNIVTVKGDYKLAKNGKGELTAIVETQKTEPKHKIEVDSKFHILTPKYDIETILIFDGDKKIYFKTENIFDKLKISTKNIAEAADKKLIFEANGNVKGEWRTNGEIQGNFILTAPNGHIIDGNIKRKISTAKSGITQGNLDVQLNDNNGDKKRTIIFSGKLERMNVKTKEIAVSNQVIYTNADERQLELNYHIKHTPKDQNTRSIDFGASIQGNIIHKPIEISFIVDEYNLKHGRGRIFGKYGQQLSINVNGNYNLGDRGTPSSFELQGNLIAPESSFEKFEINTYGKVLSPNIDEGGAYILEIHIDEKTGNSQYLRLNTILKGSRQQGSYDLDIQSSVLNSPLQLDGSYQREQSGSIRDGDINSKQKFEFNLIYGDKYIKSTSDINFSGTDTAALRYVLDTSFESAKNIDLDLRGYKTHDDIYEIVAKAKHGDKSYSFDTKLHRSAHKKGLEIKVSLPTGQPIVVIGIIEILGERKSKIRFEISNLAELDLLLNSEVSYSNIDDFYIIAEWNSNRLKLDNYKFEIRAHDKSINMGLQNAQGAVFTGIATYLLKKEKNKSIIEGQGQVTYQGKSQSSNFKLIRQVFDLNTDKEIGFAYTFNGNFGPKNGVSTVKVTNKEFNAKLSACEEKKQCTNIQVQSIIIADEQQLDSVQHSLLILIDLREVGYPYEFELQSKTNRLGFRYQYNLDSKIVSNNNLKYQLVANIVPTSSKVQLSLPKRVILLESVQQQPTVGKIFGRYEYATTFYIDKLNKPNDIMRLAALMDISGVERKVINIKSELKFEHPTTRPLTIEGKFDASREQQIIKTEMVFDIFRLPEQKITAISRLQNQQNHNGFNVTSNQQIQSTGFQFQYGFNGHTALNTDSHEFSVGAELHSGKSGAKTGAFLYSSKDHVELTVNSLDEQIVHLIGDVNSQKRIVNLDSKFQILDIKPIELHCELQPQSAKFAAKREGLIEANAEVKLGKEFIFNINGANKQLFDGRVALYSANFLQTTYKVDDENIKSFLNTANAEFQQEVKIVQVKIKKRFDKLHQWIDQQLQLIKDSMVDFSKLNDNYRNNLNEIINELGTDPALAPIIETIRNICDKISKIFDDVTRIVSESYKKLHGSFVELYEKLQNVINESVLPTWEKIIVSATKLIGDLQAFIINIYNRAIQNILSTLEKYGPALKNYSKAINEILKPLSEAAQELLNVISNALDEFLEEIRDYIAKLPTFEAIRLELIEELNKLKLVERTLEFLNNVFDQLHILPQTTETTELLQKLHEYIEAKLKQQSVNDEQLLEELIKLFIKALRSIVAAVEASSPTAAVGISSSDLHNWFLSRPNLVDIFARIPALLTFRFSLLNFILNEKWENLFSANSFRTWAFIPDFELRGHIADGQHFFTFDGQYFSYPGNCKYILAQDSVDNNFTIVAQLNNGKLKAISISDRDGNYAEVADTGSLKLNGNGVEYPQHIAGLHVWRLIYTVNLLSEYGVRIMCTSDLKVCHIHVNGFYTSKTRGLLGNGNAEPFDDYLRIDGTLAKDSASFGNDYGIGKCTLIDFDESQRGPVSHADICNEIFGLESPLSLSYLLLDSRPYRQACDIAVQKASDKEVAACTIALAYGSALRFQKKIAILPPICLKCAGQRELGEEISVKIPNKQADIVFVVDVGVNPVVLNNLVAPAILEIRDSLKSRGFTDIQIGVVAFNESLRYPALLTSNNGKINYQGNIANVQLNGPKKFCDNCISQVISEKRLLEIYTILERAINSVIPQADELAFGLALEYPFRANAAKSIVGVRSDSLQYNNLWKFVRAHTTGTLTKFDGALLHLIAPVKGLFLENVPNEKLIGFNSRLIATIDGKDNKKRSKLEFENDMGVDIVLNNGGWIFATQNFEALRPQDQKKVLNQVTSSIADSLFKTEILSDCHCVPLHGLHAQFKCIIKSSNFVPNKKPKA